MWGKGDRKGEGGVYVHMLVRINDKIPSGRLHSETWTKCQPGTKV